MNHRDSSTPMAAAGASITEVNVEAEIRRKGLTAPRITPEHLDSQIIRADYFVPGDVIALQAHVYGHKLTSVPAALACLSICVLTLRNGFTVTGESACASPENFDAELGRKIAYRNARDKIWALEGYVLRTQLHAKAALDSVSQDAPGHDANGSPETQFPNSPVGDEG